MRSMNKIMLSVPLLLLSLCIAQHQQQEQQHGFVSAAGCGRGRDSSLLAGEQQDLARPVYSERNRRAQPGTATVWLPIRVGFSTLDLDDGSKHCTTTAGGDQRVPDFKGSTIACSSDGSSDLTAQKKAELIEDVLPAVKKLIESIFRVKRTGSSLQVGSTSQCHGGFIIPSSHVSPGIPDIDFVLYISAAPTVKGTVAWAASCQKGGDGRSIVGRANINPFYITGRSKGTDTARRDVLGTMTHEIMHALGFSSSFFSQAAMLSTITVRGASKTFITSQTARDAARTYVGCQSIPGVELEDLNGDSSHVEMRMYRSEVMTSVASGIGSLSVISLAVMKDLGVYDVNWTAAQNMIVGKHEGCGYAEDASWCNTDTRNFCSATEGSGVERCTADLSGYGPCTASEYSSCRHAVAYVDRICDESTAADLPSGDTFSSTSRCVETSASFNNYNAGHGLRCLKVRCSPNNDVLYLAVGKASNVWATCTSSGVVVRAPTGSSGSITCPNITRMCDSLSAANTMFSATNESVGQRSALQPEADWTMIIAVVVTVMVFVIVAGVVAYCILFKRASPADAASEAPPSPAPQGRANAQPVNNSNQVVPLQHHYVPGQQQFYAPPQRVNVIMVGTVVRQPHFEPEARENPLYNHNNNHTTGNASSNSTYAWS